MGNRVGINRIWLAAVTFLVILTIFGSVNTFFSGTHDTTTTDVTLVGTPLPDIDVMLPDLKQEFTTVSALPLASPVDSSGDGSGSSSTVIDVPDSCSKSVSSGADSTTASVECMSQTADSTTTTNVNVSNVSQQSGNVTSTSNSTIRITINQ